MSSLVLGTAGHIDHGKSTLVKAITGTDPDRLAEEKARGITIELGFARLALPSGRTMGVVDVPGHERFVRHMVAGATGIDVVLFVVAADDGIMPQTREHLAIVDLLGVQTGVVALTKADLAEPEWIDLVTEDVRALIDTTSIAGAPIVPVSAVTGAGIPALLAELERISVEAPARHASLPMRLPVDRVFTIIGAGTVVTGTLWSGKVSRDDLVEVLPGRGEGRVRSVQVHSDQVAFAVAGQRVALNIAGIDRSGIARGDIVAAPGTLTVTDRFDAHFTYVGVPGDEQPLESGSRVHIHHGTREVIGRLLFIESSRLPKGGSAFAQVRLDEELAPRYGDRFIVRSYSPVHTIGGGVVLDAHPPRRTTLRGHERALLDALFDEDFGAAIVGLLASRGIPMSAAEISGSLGVPQTTVDGEIARASLARLKVGGETHVATLEGIEVLIDAIERELLAFHGADSKATGVATSALRYRVDRRLGPKVFDALLDLARERGVAVVERGHVHHPRAAARAHAAAQDVTQALARLVEQDGLAPRTVAMWAAEVGVDVKTATAALNRLIAEGVVVRHSSDLYFDARTVAAAGKRVEAVLREKGSASPAELRDALGVSRKYALPLLEHFDSIGLTKREGSSRVLRERRLTS